MGKNTTEASLPDKNRFIVCGNAKQSPVTAGKGKTAGEKNRITLSRGDKEKLRSLYRAFRDELDITPSKYIENRRLANAKKLLERGESVQAAAEKSGFSDYSHFISLFKKRFGTTPKKYRRVSLRQAKIAAF